MKTNHNAPAFGELAAVRLLGTILREAKQRWPFKFSARVVLSDHLYVIRLPPLESCQNTATQAVRSTDRTPHCIARLGQAFIR